MPNVVEFYVGGFKSKKATKNYHPKSEITPNLATLVILDLNDRKKVDILCRPSV
jgi:hypothetical protein